MLPLSRLAEVRAYRLPLRGRFRGSTHREGALLRGPRGWGEFAPFPDYSPQADAWWLAAAVEAMTGGVPAPLRDSVLVNAILPETAPAEVAPLVRAAVLVQGCTTVKLKVGAADVDHDVALVRAVRRALDDTIGAPTGRIRLDANGRWTPAAALEALELLAPLGLEYVEQPCATAEQIAEVRARTDVPVAVDEVLRRDRRFAGLAQIADVAVVKVAPLGGGARVLELAEQVGIPVVISSALETSVGLSRDARVAAALPVPPRACGLGSGELLAADLAVDRVLPRDGAVGVDPAAADADLLAAASGADESAWAGRIDRAWRIALDQDLLPVEQLRLLGVAA